MELALRPRSASEIVDAAFRLFRAHPGAFLTLAVVAAVPRLAIALTQIGLTFGGSLDPATIAAGRLPMFGASYLALTTAALVVTALFEGAFIALADDALHGGDPTAGRALSRGAARALPVVVAFFVVALVAGIGFLFLFVPGVYLFVRLYPAVPTVVVEGVGPIEALRRAWRRTRGNVGRGVAVYALLFGIFLLAGLAAGMVGGVLGGVVGSLTGGAAHGAVIAGLLVQQAVGVVLYPLLGAATTLFYLDTRVRSEGFDVEMMADALGALDGPGAAPVTGR